MTTIKNSYPKEGESFFSFRSIFIFSGVKSIVDNFVENNLYHLFCLLKLLF